MLRFSCHVRTKIVGLVCAATLSLTTEVSQAADACVIDFKSMRCPEGEFSLPRLPVFSNSAHPTVRTVRAKFYEAIMVYVRQRKVTRGSAKFRGMLFRDAYRIADEPKALAACLDWDRTTPDKLYFLSGTHSFQFVTGTGDCGPTDRQEAKQCALSDCRRYAACGATENCTVIDINDRNSIELPSSWVSQYLK